MRVAVLRQGYYEIDPRVQREVQALLHAGHEVDVIALREPGKPRVERDGALTVRRLRLPRRRGGALAYVLDYAVFFAAAAALLTALHARRRYDLVQVHSLPDPLVFAALIPKLTGARVLLDLHECMPEFFATKFGVGIEHRAVRAVAAAEQASIRFADLAITCTAQMREAFVRRGADGDRIGLVHNTADEDVFDPERHPPREREEGRFTLICHGSVEERYGLDTAIEAVALLKDEIPELRLAVYGTGSELPRLREQAARLEVRDRVDFSGRFVPIDELVAAIADADAGVVAMKRDVFRDLVHCNKMYDLVAMRRPVVTSRTRSVEAYFGDDCFEYFTAADAEDLARAIRALHADPALGERLVERAAEAVEPYRWPRQRERYQRYVLSAASRSRGGVDDDAP
jgi:glycosyltransferase involved in cell wall biosynthesis